MKKFWLTDKKTNDFLRKSTEDCLEGDKEPLENQRNEQSSSLKGENKMKKFLVKNKKKIITTIIIILLIIVVITQPVGIVLTPHYILKLGNNRVTSFINRAVNSLYVSESAVIPSSTVFHAGGFGVLIHSNVILGENVHIHPLVIIGNANYAKTIIGNNVTLLEGAFIAGGGVRIGNNVIIGVNEYINFDVPSNTIIGKGQYKEVEKEAE